MADNSPQSYRSGQGVTVKDGMVGLRSRPSDVPPLRGTRNLTVKSGFISIRKRPTN